MHLLADRCRLTLTFACQVRVGASKCPSCAERTYKYSSNRLLPHSFSNVHPPSKHVLNSDTFCHHILAHSAYIIYHTFISVFSYLCARARLNYSYSGVTHVDKSDLTPNFRAAESETINSRLSHAVTLEESLLFHRSRSAFARSHPSFHRSSSSLQIRQLGRRSSSVLTPPAPSLPPVSSLPQPRCIRQASQPPPGACLCF